MKKKKPESGGFRAAFYSQPVVVEDGSGDVVTGLWIKAVISLGAACFIGFRMGMNWVVDMEDPEFNPLTFAVLGIGAYGLVSVVKGVWLTLRYRRFGKSELRLSGDGVARLGQRIEGVVRTEVPLTGAGTARLHLRCVDIHQFRDIGGGATAPQVDFHDFAVWEAAVEVPIAGVDTVGVGIPFQFQLPESVGEEAKRQKPPNPYFKGSFALMIPGMKRRIWTSGVQPVSRVWELTVRSETSAGAYAAVFQMPVQRA